MAGQAVYVGLFSVIFINTFMEATAQHNSHEREIRNPVTLTSISISTNYDNKSDTRVTINYVATKPVQVLWTIDEGFSPTALDNKAVTSFTQTSASVLLPDTLIFEAIHVQLNCAEELFELHIDLDKSRFSNGIFPVKQYLFYVPPNNEIGLSPLGESQFHVFVNLTGTPFSFGMLLADVVGKKQDRTGSQLFAHSSFSFLPDSEFKNVRLKTIDLMHTLTEKHFDVILREPALHTYGGILSLLAACPTSNPVIKRMDMKQTIHIHPPAKPVLPLGFLSLVDINIPSKIYVSKSDKVFIRCKAIGNPTPSLTLTKFNDNIVNSKNSDSDLVPSYVTSLPFEITKTFQFINVTTSHYGSYTCKAKKGKQTAHKKYNLLEA